MNFAKLYGALLGLTAFCFSASALADGSVGPEDIVELWANDSDQGEVRLGTSSSQVQSNCSRGPRFTTGEDDVKIFKLLTAAYLSGNQVRVEYECTSGGYAHITRVKLIK